MKANPGQVRRTAGWLLAHLPGMATHWWRIVVLLRVAFRFQSGASVTIVGRERAMPLSPPSLSLGVEEEYLLVDPESRDLVAAPPKGFMAHCQRRLAGRATHELLQAQVEVDTRVCPDIAEVRRELAELRATDRPDRSGLRHGADRGLDAPVRQLARPAPGRQGALQRARPRHGGAGRAPDDLRHAHPRRHRG